MKERNSVLHSRQGAVLKTGCSTQDRVQYSRQGAVLKTGCSTQDRVQYSRQGAVAEDCSVSMVYQGMRTTVTAIGLPKDAHNTSVTED